MLVRWRRTNSDTDGTAGDPHAPSTTAPLSKVTEDIGERHSRIYPRLVSRGDMLPYKGRSVTLPDGTTGGVPQGLPPVFGALRGVTIRAEGVPHQAIPHTIKKAVMKKLVNIKSVAFRIRPGLHAIDVAKSPRLIPDLPNGYRGGYNDLQVHETRGQLSQQWGIPRSIYERERHKRPIATEGAIKGGKIA